MAKAISNDLFLNSDRSFEELMNNNVINKFTRCTISDMSNKVLEHIAKKYENVKEGVESVMGGKVLEYEAKTIRNQSKLEILIDLVQCNTIPLRVSQQEVDYSSSL